MKSILSSIAGLLALCMMASAAEDTPKGNVDQIETSDTGRPAKREKLYDERYRPQFHISPMKNWMNDPNGMVFYKGEYHLFFQHNPAGINWDNMTWGHAVSPDMLHWKQLDHAIYPDKLGMIYSGSAVVDWNNTAGFQTGDENVIVCIYTSAGGMTKESHGQPFTQSIAYSNDRGRTWTKYEKNPVLKHIDAKNRDPKVLWHAPSKKWVMALYLDGDKFALLSSPNLKDWTKLCDIVVRGGSECPDFFALPVDGDTNNVKWVFWVANNCYLLGTFDGTTFREESGPHATHFGKHRYAAQTFSDISAADGRRIQIAWMGIDAKYPDMPFNQQMSFPAELLLKQTVDGLRVVSRPAKELELLHGSHHTWSGEPMDGENLLKSISGDLFEIRAEIEPGTAKQITLLIRGTPLDYDVGKAELSLLGKIAPLRLQNGGLNLQVLIDRSSIEVFCNGGEVTMASCFLPPRDDKSLSLTGPGAMAKSLDIWELKSSWVKQESP